MNGTWKHRWAAWALVTGLVFPGLTHAATKVWDGDAATANWTDPGNWDADGVPVENVDDIVIGQPGDPPNTTTVNLGGVDRQVKGVTVTLEGVTIQPGATSAYLRIDMNSTLFAKNVTFEGVSSSARTGFLPDLATPDIGNVTLENVVTTIDMNQTWRIRGLGAGAKTLSITDGEINNGQTWTIAEDGAVVINGSNAGKTHRTGGVNIGTTSAYTTGTARLEVRNADLFYVSSSLGLKAGQYQSAQITLENTRVRTPHLELYDNATLTTANAEIWFQPQNNTSGFVIRQTSASKFDGEGLTVRFAPSADRTATFEVAGLDLGPEYEGLAGNYSLDRLILGESGRTNVNSTMRLVDDFNNNGLSPTWTPEALYVSELIVGGDLTLDLNGFKLYYHSFVNDNGSGGQYQLNVINGELLRVPEPGSAALLLGGAAVALFRGRRSR